MTLKEFIELIYLLGGDMNTELWVCDNDGHYVPLSSKEIEKDVDNSINIYAGI